MAWIEFDPARIKKLPKFRRLKATLGWSVNETLGFLGQLWREVLEVSPSGDLTGWTPDFLADLTDAMPAAPETIWKALTTVPEGSEDSPWIENRGGRWLVHDWLDRAGPFLIRRYSGHNRKLLDEIWEKHGRTYGRSDTYSTKSTHHFDELVSLPTNQTPPHSTEPTSPKNLSAPAHERDASGIVKMTGRMLIDLWNELAPIECPKVKEFTESRIRKANVRVREHPECDWWLEVMEKIQKSEFLKGGGNRDWRATFDWLIVNDKNAIKVIEGAYTNKKGATHGNAGPQKYGQHVPRMPERN